MEHAHLLSPKGTFSHDDFARTVNELLAAVYSAKVPA